MGFRFIDDECENYGVALPELAHFRESQSPLGKVIGDALVIGERSVLLPDPAAEGSHLLVSLDVLLRNWNHETVDVLTHVVSSTAAAADVDVIPLRKQGK
jgi:hypothetical protein